MWRVLRGGAPLSHSDERATVHDDAPVTPRLPCDPFDEVVAVASDLQPEIFALGAAGAAPAAHQCLHKNVAAPREVGGRGRMAAAIDVVLCQRQYRRHFFLEIRWLGDPGLN